MADNWDGANDRAGSGVYVAGLRSVNVAGSWRCIIRVNIARLTYRYGRKCGTEA